MCIHSQRNRQHDVQKRRVFAVPYEWRISHLINSIHITGLLNTDLLEALEKACSTEERQVVGSPSLLVLHYSPFWGICWDSLSLCSSTSSTCSWPRRAPAAPATSMDVSQFVGVGRSKEITSMTSTYFLSYVWWLIDFFHPETPILRCICWTRKNFSRRIETWYERSFGIAFSILDYKLIYI